MRKYLYTYLVIHVLAMMQGPLAWAQAFKHEPISDKLFKAMQAGHTCHEIRLCPGSPKLL